MSDDAKPVSRIAFAPFDACAKTVYSDAHFVRTFIDMTRALHRQEAHLIHGVQQASFGRGYGVREDRLATGALIQVRADPEIPEGTMLTVLREPGDDRAHLPSGWYDDAEDDD